MHKIIFFIIVFFINSVAAKTPETNKRNFQFEQVKVQLEKHCYNCLDKSVNSFERATIELEKITQINSKDEKLTDKEILLSDSYEQLIYDFYNNNKSKQAIYITKQYKLLEQLTEKSKTEKEVIFFAKKLAEAYMNEWHALNKTFDDPEYLVYREKVKKLTKDMRSYVKKIKIQAPNKIKILNKRVNNLILTDADIKLIDEIINELFETNTRPTRDRKVYIQHLTNALMNTVKLNQLSRDQLSKISRFAIMLQNYYFASKWKSLDDIIWWCEVRNIQNKADQLQFLNNQMISNRKLDALKMLVELGQVEIVEKWSKELSSENSETIFNLAIRQAKLRQASLEKDKHLAKLFQKQFNLSLTEIAQNKLLDNPHYQQHIHWLIIQIGTHKIGSKFERTLRNLAQDNLFYNRNLKKNTSKQKIKELSEVLETKLKITSDAKFVLNSDVDE